MAKVVDAYIMERSSKFQHLLKLLVVYSLVYIVTKSGCFLKWTLCIFSLDTLLSGWCSGSANISEMSNVILNYCSLVFGCWLLMTCLKFRWYEFCQYGQVLGYTENSLFILCNTFAKIRLYWRSFHLRNYWPDRVEVKLPLCLIKHHALKTYCRSRSIASYITRWRWMVGYTARPLYPAERDPITRM